MVARRVEFTPADFTAMCGFGKRLTFGAGEVVFERGAVEQCMYLVDRGEVELVFPGGKGSKVLGPGSYFGELAFLIGEHRRSATVRAHTECTLVLADQSTVDALLARNPRLLFALLRHSCSYLLDSEQGLIADLQRKNAELERMIDYLQRTRAELDQKDLLAQTDPLTGLTNRRGLDEQLPRLLERARVEGAGVAVLMLDLDGFKQVNDSLGHAAGDEVLVRVAGILTGHTRRSDLTCRLGGDEFAVVLPGITEARAREVAEHIRRSVAAAFPAQVPGRAHVTASLGLSRDDGVQGADELLARADARLYEAKRQGKDQVR